MVAPITSNISVNRGLCPHGMPFGACPICSGKGGGGGISSGRNTAKAGEMTWDECYAVGQMLKAQAQRKEDATQFNLSSVFTSIQSNKTIQAMSEKFAAISNFVNTVITRPTMALANRIITAVTTPIINLANRIAQSTPFKFGMEIAENIKKGFTNITDKLAAIIGEPLNAMADFIAENWKKIKPKKYIFFSEVDTEMEQGEQDEEVELKRWLHLRSLKENITKLLNPNKKEYAEWS
ncbi:MAG: hypothetical protein PHE78_04280 [Candidatus Gastranaerophilales bacterium]|nr:hypothetical protein [Candidatus Gastranaerophilales bacterium]